MENSLTRKEIEDLKTAFDLHRDLTECDIEWKKQLEPKLISMKKKEILDEILSTTAVTNGKIAIY